VTPWPGCGHSEERVDGRWMRDQRWWGRWNWGVGGHVHRMDGAEGPDWTL
jgi:hypothetical protein